MSRYSLSGPNVVHQEIEGEVIVVDLQKGHYFSLTGSAVPAWKALLRGCDAGSAAEELGSIYKAAPGEIVAGVSELVKSLLGEGLLVEDTKASASGAEVPPPASDKLPFEAPRLQKYTDMEDVLVLDPIHDVDESGWPNARK